jgi:hypothetical protein
MNVADYIVEQILKPRLKKDVCLVVYDPERRYRDLCLGMGNQSTIVVDATENSLESRHDALKALKELGATHNGKEGLLIYIPTKKPLTDDEKLLDPFAIYGESGTTFPQLDGDDFKSICLKAKQNNQTEIEKLFNENPSPTFAMVDAISGGINYPQLKATLKAESVRDILLALLLPNDIQKKTLSEQDGWISEAKDLFRSSLGLELKTRAKSLSNITTELWRFILFSEFIFDLPSGVPVALKTVPVASIDARGMVESICDNLRNNIQQKQKYIVKAEEIEAELKLPQICSDLEDLGEKDTFPFEERTFFKRAISGIKNNDYDLTRLMLARQKRSVWQGKGESKIQWNLIEAALSLIENCKAFESELFGKSQTQADLLNFYIETLHNADRLQREFEQAVSNFFDSDGLMIEVITQARSSYRKFSEKVQTVFVKHLESSGWTPPGRLANADVFEKFVGGKLKERGKRIAYFMVDALRYELGVELYQEILKNGDFAELQTAYAQLPTITTVGMASLLPGGKNELFLDCSNNTIVHKIGEQTVSNVKERMNYIRKRFNDRFHEMQLEKFVREKQKFSQTVDLLVLRSTEIDSQLENNPETTLGLIPHTLKMIRAALYKLKNLGFNEAVIATDHGFFLNGKAKVGMFV